MVINLFDNILKKKSFWNSTGNKSDIVLSSRLRLARNLPGLPFPNYMDTAHSESVFNTAKDISDELKKEFPNSFFRIKDIPDNDRRFLRERNLITSEMENSISSALLLDENTNFSILINEKDHFRIQIIKSGLDLFNAYREIDKIDNKINKIIPYSYSEKFGFLTSDLCSTGTGLKASVLLHLPMISIMKSQNEVEKMAQEMDCNFKAVTGDYSKNYGAMYIISNKTSIGKSEIDIIEQIDDLTDMVIDLEYEIRDDYMFDSAFLMRDRVWRSYGLIKYSNSLNYPEALEYLSNLRIGIILSVIKEIHVEEINDIMVKIQHSHLEKIRKEPFVSPFECDEFRAKYIRSMIPDIKPED